jgi:hypothetical protein
MNEKELGAGVQVIHKGKKKYAVPTEAKGRMESSKCKLYVKDG